jgi:hypothetical protein
MSHRRASSSIKSQDKQSSSPCPSLVPPVAAAVLVGSTSVAGAEGTVRSPAAAVGHSSQVVAAAGSSYLLLWRCRLDVSIEMRIRGW